MLEIHCFMCKRELSRPGALVIGPPVYGEDEKHVMKVEKIHLCGGDWLKLKDFMESALNKEAGVRDEGLR